MTIERTYEKILRMVILLTFGGTRREKGGGRRGVSAADSGSSTSSRRNIPEKCFCHPIPCVLFPVVDTGLP